MSSEVESRSEERESSRSSALARATMELMRRHCWRDGEVGCEDTMEGEDSSAAPVDERWVVLREAMVWAVEDRGRGVVSWRHRASLIA